MLLDASTRFSIACDAERIIEMSAFNELEHAYLTMSGRRRLGRIATVGGDGTPHVTPTGWVYNAEHDTIDVGGHNVRRTKKYRDVKSTGRAAIVIDDVLPPWRPRAVEIRGRAEVIEGPRVLIRIYPDRIVSWGLDEAVEERDDTVA
jgi:pyridoxamine 5'-phosphate oxidase family protein